MPEITIHESTSEAGDPLRTGLAFDGERLALTVAGEVLPLPDGALEAVMKRFGKPLGVTEAETTLVERLELGQGKSVVRFRFLARYDVIAKDYLAFYDPPAEPSCELATSVTAALTHLARRLAGTR